eukprot:CAMPEP_0119146970 /NCGR_PEP_ID=MMETSP1310-20130426/39698_1 /TAXON_ID=464262 /ORGANISM="Genus nov. species nov., Strain RCC2339" /LENGTH=184 /DNA_ID=CAMNT_0007138897 /DNA_START=77 /DNA_END=627 /DNA_ORIENTATION=-
MADKQHWGAPERNKLAIWGVLEGLLEGRNGTVLEVASGSGQHAGHFAPLLPDGVVWQPSELDAGALFGSIRAWTKEYSNVRDPVRLDVLDEDWPVGGADVVLVFTANLLHIAPFQCSEGLFRGAGRTLSPGGNLAIYGPFKIDGHHTTQSNADFDASLRARDPSWGVRNLNDLEELARLSGLEL